MKKLLLLLLFFPFVLTAQISGVVKSKTTNEPIIGASVFINNTTIGTITDENGKFQITKAGNGKHELIVSIVGFERYATVVELPGQPSLNISLVEKNNQLNEVIVQAFDKDGWAKWGTLFLETFIGSTSNAAKTKLKNHKDLRFRHNKADNKLEVYAVKPLQIENNSLGYTLEYHLEIFEVDFRNRKNLYAGFPFFKESKKPSKAKLQNREDTYNASLIKFMRSLYHNTVQQDGYLVRKMVDVPNLEKKRVKAIRDKYILKEYNSNGQLITFGAPMYPPEIYNQDSLNHFKKILSQPDSQLSLYKDTLSVYQIVSVDENQKKMLFFKDYLHVVNSKFKEDKKFIEYQRQNRNPGPQTSFLLMAEDEKIEIQENGNYFPPLNIFSGDYWGWSNKIADLLPLDYKPTKKSSS